MRRPELAALVCMLGMLTLSATAEAGPAFGWRPDPTDPNAGIRYWVNGSGLWNDATHWAEPFTYEQGGAGEPEGHSALLRNDGPDDVIVTFQSNVFSDPIACLASLYIVGSGDGTMRLSQGQDVLRAHQAMMDGRAVCAQTGGTFEVQFGLFVGFGSNTAAIYDLSGGSLSTGGTAIGTLGGVGQFNQSGGTHTITSWFTMGDELLDVGTYHLSGTGSLAVGEYEIVGAAGTGLFNQFDGTHTVAQDLILGYTWSGAGAYDLQGGSLSTGRTYVGYQGVASFYQSDGNHSVGTTLFVGEDDIASGTYELSGGRVSAPRGYIGDSGDGRFTQTGGIAEFPDLLYVAYAAPSSGVYELSGSGTLSGQATIVGVWGEGTFRQSSGTHSLSSYLAVGYYADGHGAYELTDGDLTPGGYEIIGHFGTGTFRQTGGTNTMTSALSVGQIAGSSGTFELVDGSVACDAVYVGNQGTGVFDQTGGTVTADSLLLISASVGSAGTYYLRGGSVSTDAAAVGNSGANAILMHSGGSLTVSDRLVLGNIHGSRGYYRLSETGEVSAATMDVGNFGTGKFEQVGGAVSVLGDLWIQHREGGSGAYSLEGGSLMAARVVNYGTFSFSGGSFVANLVNYGQVILKGAGLRVIAGDVQNEGDMACFKADDTEYLVTGTFLGNAVHDSDPSTGHFADMVIGPQGIIVGGVGDRFLVGGDLIVRSIRAAEWNTDRASLEFVGGPGTSHEMSVAGADLGGTGPEGYQDNFAWGTLHLSSGNSLALRSSDANSAGALYVRALELEDGLAQLPLITANGVRVYYLAWLPENAYLGGQTFVLTGGGEIAPAVPEPSTLLLLGSGAVWAIVSARRLRVLSSPK